MGWRLTTLPLLCAGTALLELDNAHVAQTMVSRPIVAGPLVGWLAGSPDVGMAFGVFCEMLTADEPPVGHVVPLNGTLASAAAVLLASGPEPVHPDLALPAGLGVGWLFARVEGAIRSCRSAMTRAAEEAPEGRDVSFGRLAARSLGVHAAAAAGLLYAAVAALGPVLVVARGSAPGPLLRGTSWALQMAPFLGCACLLRAFWPRQAPRAARGAA